MLTREELIKRGARFKDGRPIPEIVAPDPVSPLVGSPTMDTAPIADAMKQLSEVVRTAIDAHAPVLAKIAELKLPVIETKRPPEVWDFEIKRDTKGRIESIRAVAVLGSDE